MRFAWTILVLLIAAAGVWAMLRTADGDLLARERSRSTSVQRLLSPAQLPIDELSRITLRRGERTFTFSREGGRWIQVEPFTHPMDPFSIRQLALQARELDVLDTIDPDHLRGGLSPEALSLEPALAEITYEWPGGTRTLQLGRRAVAGRAYLRIAGESDIFIVNPNLHERAIDMDHKEWRDRTIFADAGVESASIEWQAGDFRMRLVRDRKQWMMAEPARTRLDPTNRDAYLQAIGRAVVAGYILDQPNESDLAKFGLAPPQAKLTIASGDAAPQTLLIGSQAGGGTMDHFAMIEGRHTVVRLSGAVIAALFRQPQDLAAATASGVIAADVKAIVIRSGSEQLRLERELEQWRAARDGSSEGAAGALQPMNAAHVQQLLEQLTQLRASSVQIAEYPRDLEVATITMHGFDGRALDTVRIVKEQESGRWGMENGDNVIRIYPASLNPRLTAKEFGLQ